MPLLCCLHYVFIYPLALHSQFLTRIWVTRLFCSLQSFKPPPPGQSIQSQAPSLGKGVTSHLRSGAEACFVICTTQVLDNYRVFRKASSHTCRRLWSSLQIHFWPLCLWLPLDGVLEAACWAEQTSSFTQYGHFLFKKKKSSSQHLKEHGVALVVKRRVGAIQDVLSHLQASHPKWEPPTRWAKGIMSGQAYAGSCPTDSLVEGFCVIYMLPSI